MRLRTIKLPVDRSNHSLHAGSRGMCTSAGAEITFFIHQVSFIACIKFKMYFFLYNEDIMYYHNMF